MHYMVSLNPYSINGFGQVHTVDTNVPGGLGYTYPNPMQLQDKLWLFWRGGAWNPTFSYTDDGIHWVPARELVYFGHAQRPYTKYVGDGKRRIHGIFTDGHPENWKNSLHYVRYENEALYAMRAGASSGRSRTVPLHTSKLDHIYNYSDARRARLGPRHRAHRRRPAAGRLHAPGQQPRHLLLRLPQRHEVDQPQDRRGRRRAPVLPLGRRDASTTRTRASSTCRARSGTGTRSSSGSRRTRGARGRTGS